MENCLADTEATRHRCWPSTPSRLAIEAVEVGHRGHRATRQSGPRQPRGDPGTMCAMAHEGQELLGHNGYRLRFVRITPELLEMEAFYSGAGPFPPEHFHPRQDEHFEVL